MNRIKNWQKLVALTLFIILLGGYYEQFSLETKAMVLPLGIIFVAAFVITRFKQLEYEMRSSKVMAHDLAVQTFSIVDSNGKKRISISSDSDKAIMIFYDENHTARVTLELLHQEPKLTLAGDKGSALIAFGEEGQPNFTLKDDTDTTIWSAL